MYKIAVVYVPGSDWDEMAKIIQSRWGVQAEHEDDIAVFHFLNEHMRNMIVLMFLMSECINEINITREP